MEYVKTLAQEVAEVAVSYRVGQALLKQADRALGAVESSAKWAVPPALEDDNPSDASDLVRPLPWVFFLSLLVALRATREGLSLVNLVLGKPPVRAADVVTYLQSKRRYLRALKYQGNRLMRARSSETSGTLQLLSNLQSLLGATLCFNRTSSEHHSDDEQIMVVKKKNKGRKDKESGYASPVHDENTMEKLIEKMVDMYGDSSDDSDYTLTNAESVKSDSSATSEDSSLRDATITKSGQESEPASSTPVKSHSSIRVESPSDCSDERSAFDSSAEVFMTPSPKVESSDLINSERTFETDSSKKSTRAGKNANGQTSKASSSSSGKKDASNRRDSEVPLVKITPANDQNTNGTEEK